MKKGIIAIALLVSGVLLITPIANAISQNNKQENVAPVKVEQATNTAKTEVVKNNEEKTTQKQEAKKPAKVETVAVKTKKTAKVKVETKKEEAKKVETKKEETTKPANNTVVKDDKDKEEVKTGMTKSQAEAVLNKYLKEVEKVDFTYTYQGNEDTFKAMNKKKE
ncbi:hypothetical protein L0P85_05265 [Terrisporobacter glycolicus]|nr:hypothetical protein L0P85_05265 [Terrisporobacter glycolicus]